MATNYLKVKSRDHIVLYQEGEVESRYEHLPAGVYHAMDVGGPFHTLVGFKPAKMMDKLIRFKTGIVGSVLDKADKFFSPETGEKYKLMGVARKIGMVFYGPPGTGKTATAMLIMIELVNKYGAICLDMTGKKIGFIRHTLREIRKIQNNPIVVFVDEVEGCLCHEENEYLTFLDGGESIDDFIFLGCTNFFEKIPKRIRQRRSRLKITEEIKSLPTEVYKEFIREKISGIREKEVTKIAFLAEEKGLTIDELKNSLIYYHIYDEDIEQAMEKAKNYNKQENWEND
jgi:SpoVK/Ycf46/Vps4 family AAA+-type ATPase